MGYKDVGRLVIGYGMIVMIGIPKEYGIYIYILSCKKNAQSIFFPFFREPTKSENDLKTDRKNDKKTVTS